MKSSRARLGVHIGLLATIFFVTGAAAQDDKTPTLKDAFKGRFSVGVAVNRSIVTDVASPFGSRTLQMVEKDIALTEEQFNQISPENDLKWASIHPREGAGGYNFGPADAYVDFGRKNHMLIVGHTLVWHNQTPNWVFAGTGTEPRATREELLQRMRDHILTVMGRYKGRIQVWDVVNECVSDSGPDILRNSLWRQIIGPDFVAQAFEYAHEADSQAILRLNDYGLENPDKRRRFITLVKQLQAQKVPIMAIGTQTHVSVSSPSFDEEDQVLTDLDTLGLPIHITELDVNGAQGGQSGTGADIAGSAETTQGGLVADADRRLADQYAGLFKAFRKHKNVKVVTFWGVNDGVSWRAGGKPLLFDKDDQPKPAFDAVIRVAQDHSSNTEEGIAGGVGADQPVPRTDADSQLGHAELVEKAKKGGIDIYFEGDSITRRWGCRDPQYADLLANWKTNFFGWNAADFGWGGDRTENILWRLNHGELDGVHPKIIVIQAGTNNIGTTPGGDAQVADVTRGIRAIRDVCRAKAPGATLILTAIFPRNDNIAVMPIIDKINANIAGLCDGKSVRYLNVNAGLADKEGRLFPGMMNASDHLHPTVKGYQVWADGLKPLFTALLGPPAVTDHAPPPTADPANLRPR